MGKCGARALQGIARAGRLARVFELFRLSPFSRYPYKLQGEGGTCKVSGDQFILYDACVILVCN